MEKTSVNKKTDGILFRSGIMFLLFTVVTLILSGITLYLTETGTYRRQCQDNIRQVARYLNSLIQDDADNFLAYHKYFMEHYKEMEVPISFDEYHKAYHEFLTLFNERYPGKIYGADIEFNDMDPDLQKLYAQYYHEYWLLNFEKARDDFSLAYSYYITFTENNDDSYEEYYVLDAERTERDGSGGKYLHLGDQYHHTPAEQPVEWKVWSTGEETDEFQEWNNAWGHTYTYYVPLKIRGEKLGLICTEIDVESVSRGIFVNTLRLEGRIGLVLILCVGVMLFLINRGYISRIVKLSNNVTTYSRDKDPAIAALIEKEGAGADELSILSSNTAGMIREIDGHMKKLTATHKELNETKMKASNMQALANKDALTGIRNKTAYDQETAQIDKSVLNGFTEFGIAMIDLNFLKKINDTYGHEQGNVAIKKLCHIVCVIFDHSPVFRIGGDEFVVILKGHDMEHYDELRKRFEDEMLILKADDSLNDWEKVSAAIGAAFFDPSTDKTVADVFKRADNLMYERKKEMKAARGTVQG